MSDHPVPQYDMFKLFSKDKPKGYNKSEYHVSNIHKRCQFRVIKAIRVIRVIIIVNIKRAIFKELLESVGNSPDKP